MAKNAIATLQPIWDCRWSRPGYRVFCVGGDVQPQKLWVCLRDSDHDRRPVTEAECEHCVFWEALPGAERR